MTVEVTTPSDREVTMSRTFNTPREMLFEAWTKPELLKRWLYGPKEWPLSRCEIDLRVGGKLRFEWGPHEGKSMGFSGIYREIAPPDRLAFTEVWDDNWTGGETLVTIKFIERAGKTTVSQTILYTSLASRDAALKTGMARGQAQAYERLEEILASKTTKESPKQKIVTFLWFDNQVEEAVNFYVSIFKNSRIVNVSRYGDAGAGPKGSVMSAIFELEGQRFYALNGGPLFHFTPAISLFVNCETQEEVDELWEKLIAGGGKPDRCGWLKDKYDLSWQIIPTALGEMLQDKDPKKSASVMKAMLQMDKLDITKLKQAYSQV